MEYVGKGLGLTLCVAHSVRSGYTGDARKCSWCATAVTSRVRIGWMKLRKRGELLRGRFLKMKGWFITAAQDQQCYREVGHGV